MNLIKNKRSLSGMIFLKIKLIGFIQIFVKNTISINFILLQFTYTYIIILILIIIISYFFLYLCKIKCQ